jgi:beta-glucosidase
LRNVARASLAAAIGCASVLLGAAHAQSPSRAEALLQKMTLEEKIGQLVQRAGGRSKALNSRLDDAELERVRAGQVGSYLHVAGAEPLAKLQKVAVEESRLGVPLLFAMDVVHGYRTIFPVPVGMASTWKPESLEAAARVAAVEATAAGLHWTFAPMIDIARDPRWGRIVEGAGEDPYLGAQLAVAQVRGYQGNDLARADTLMATAKHFGAYGAAIGGRDYNSADVSERTLHEVYLPPFYAAAKAGSASFMSAFNDIGGVPTTANRALVRTLLRERWGYQGVLVSDWNAIAELLAHGVAADRKAAALLALQASIDMDMVGAVYEQDLKQALQAHPEQMKSLDEAVLRLLRMKEALGLFDRPMQYHDARREKQVLLAAEHRELARSVARESIVLLKNDGAVLPLQPTQLETLAVVGALASDGLSMLGSWRAQGRAEEVVTILQGIERAAPKNLKVIYAAGADPRNADVSGIPAAVQAVAAADAAVLVIGEHFDLSGEARSRADISLPPSQVELAREVLATGKPVVVVLANGRPLAMPWLAENAPAILETWMLGVEAGHAVADIVFGRYSPAGRLPAAFPRASGAVPFYYAANPTGRPADPDLSKDTARYMDQPITPQFPFGHGLSYTTFEYSDLSIDRERITASEDVTIKVTVRNTGRVASDEVVQLYVRDPIASVGRPVKELRGFKRVTLPAGEQTRIAFRLSARQLALYGLDNRWRVEPGRIEVMIGASSADIRARGAFEITNGIVSDVPAAAIATVVAIEPIAGAHE